MSIQKQLKTLTYLVITSALLFWGCESTLNTESGSGTGSMVVKLHDAPVDYDEVNISVARVEVNNTQNEDGWIVISEPNEIYNILDLVNGEMAVLADAELEVGTYEQIRLILNDANTVVINGETFELFVPSGEQTGVKLNINAEILEGIQYTLLLDFDANRSVVKKGVQDLYNLKPVIRATNEAITGNISGTILPIDTRATVYAIQESDTLSTTFADTSSGEFTLVGLESGSYTVSVEPREEGFEPAALDEVSVTVGETNEIGEIELNTFNDDADEGGE
ncbi:DUF4382 domain-containing protein [Rhodohalobacter sp. SW132]|uniref:DUF4382 domain-containing protein n=1 Tax=Rhodohalobacter sp. SW132 TaxID=2293433 RepID=UPI000E25F3E5|nr:DUF4382 domain-containing protein [Rhodohalobacter sp. SW132]REL29082.1 DUF4382 domain-containing protein [Rhodohalobacter sp. SW132]